jgi:hypothetical protein
MLLGSADISLIIQIAFYRQGCGRRVGISATGDDRDECGPEQTSKRASSFATKRWFQRGLPKSFYSGRMNRPISAVVSQKPPPAGTHAKPSDGLEPSTPSLPWKVEGGTSGHERSRTATKSLQTAGS